MAEDAHLAWDLVDRLFKAEQALGEVGADCIRRLAARASVHECPYALCLMTSLVGCLNGAHLDVWPGRSSPVSLFCLVGGMAQTRKSQMTNVMCDVARVVDKACQERARRQGRDVSKVKTCVLTNFTEAAFWQRCSSEWEQCPGTDPAVPQRRLHYTTLVSLDEAYKMMRMLGLCGKDAESGPAESASQWNNFLQSGHSSLTCKGVPGYESTDLTVSLPGVGNQHAAR